MSSDSAARYANLLLRLVQSIPAIKESSAPSTDGAADGTASTSEAAAWQLIRVSFVLLGTQQLLCF